MTCTRPSRAQALALATVTDSTSSNETLASLAITSSTRTAVPSPRKATTEAMSANDSLAGLPSATPALLQM
jgi:hypothetical protein